MPLFGNGVWDYSEGTSRIAPRNICTAWVWGCRLCDGRTRMIDVCVCVWLNCWASAVCCILRLWGKTLERQKRLRQWVRKGGKRTVCTPIENVRYAEAVKMFKPSVNMLQHHVSSLYCVQSEIFDVQDKAFSLVVRLKFLWWCIFQYWVVWVMMICSFVSKYQLGGVCCLRLPRLKCECVWLYSQL